MKTLTVVELEFMRKLWKLGEASPEEMKKSFGDSGKVLTGGTIRKMLGILLDKGFVERKKEGRAYRYRPAAPAEKTKSELVKDIINRAYDGSLAHMFASFLGNEKVSPDDLDKIAVMIERHRKERGR